MHQSFFPSRAACPVQPIRNTSSRALALVVIMFLLCLCSGARLALAQAIYGTISGTVTDATGAAVPNATVTVIDIAKGTTKTVQSGSDGFYTVNQLIPDSYSVKATATNFTPAENNGVTVAADTTQTVNLQVTVGGASQTVTVTTAAPALKTDRADVGQVLDQRQIQNLPNLDRNFTSFALLTPGVQRSSFNIAPTENPQGTTALNANGSNYGTLGYVLDGTDNREPVDGIIVINPTLDSISEMKVDTQNFPAEFGGSVGGVVTAQTRSGGNAFHGDAFFYRRSDALAARNPFTQFQPDPVTGRLIPSALYSQFGGSVGGPIKKEKAFFFLDYQGTRQKVGSSLQQNVPTATVRNTCLNAASPTCDLSQYGGGVISNALVTPQGRTLLSAFPQPNAGAPGATSNNYIASGSGNNDGDLADTRLDYQVTSTIHAFGRYDYANFRLLGAPALGAAGGDGFGIGGTTGTDQVQNQSVSVGFDWAVRSDLLTDFRFGFLDYHVSENKFDVGTTPAAAAGLPNLNTGTPDTSGSPTFNVVDNSISSFGTQGCNCPLQESEQVFQLVNNWTKLVGNHTIKFGGDVRYALNLRNASDSNRTGQLSFNNTTGAGSGIGAVLTGQIAQFQRFDVYDNNAANRQKRGGFYAQDTWRVTPKLTLDYGVRWDIIFPETVNSAGAGGFTDLQAGVIRVAGIGGVASNGGASVDLLNLGGRFGFAYQVRPNTVIRGAVGQVYDDVGFFGTIFGSSLTQNVPVVNAENQGSSSATTPLPFTYNTLPAQVPQIAIPANGILPILNNIGYNVRPNRLLLPKVDQYNISLQQAISSDTTVTIAYVGNIAERIYPSETEGFNVNQPVLPTSPAQLANRDLRRPYFDKLAGGTCCSQDINSLAPAARANYNALQTTVEKRFSHGVQLLGNYTWSKAMNYGATYFANDPRVEYGPNDTNRNQLFVLSGMYELPFGRNKMLLGNVNRAMNYVVGGWQLAGTTTWESGLPFTPTYAECGSDQDIDTNSSNPSTSSDCRPDKAVGSLPLSVGSLSTAGGSPSRRYFTPVAAFGGNGSVSGPFARPAFGTFGNIGRNSYRGPSDYFADASLFKNFDITERVKAQFQFQAFNVFNHVPLGVPNASDARCVDCSDGGVITNVDNAILNSGQPVMRQLQFGAKFTF